MINDTNKSHSGREAIEMPAAHTPSASPKSVCEKNVMIECIDGKPVEPVAIIGMSCRLSGTAQDPSSLWDMLVSGRTSWTPIPERRFNIEAFHDPSGEKAGTIRTCGGHFLKGDISAFDAAFFGIQHTEATAMDPQQRLLLEIAYEAFENAGLSTDSLWGSNTGVYVGQWASDYLHIETRDIDSQPFYLISGSGPAISSNRISYHFNLRGPSFTLDTGCSSSLVALHQAVQSLRSGETSQCFVGGVNLLLDPQRFESQTRVGILSKEGKSFPFDSRANGYGRGEGCTGVVLKPLAAALRDGNHVRAVIRNSVLNQDGRTQGIFAPNADAQKEAILRAYQQAKLNLDVDYVEAHGTGTKVGDPIEASAIAAALTQGKASDFRLPMGSIKGNIGHTEAAAGLAALIKAVLMLEHGVIPPQANYETQNPDVLLDEWKLRIPTKLERQQLRRISVNSFGYGGANAHVIVDATDHAMASIIRQSLQNGMHSLPKSIEASRVFFISAASEKSCQQMCSRLAEYLVLKRRVAPNTSTLLAQLAYSLGQRSIHAHRLTLVASDLIDLVGQLNMASHSPIPRQQEKSEPRVGFVFSGQGAQYAQMGRELLQHYPTFARSIERARQQVILLGGQWDLVTELCQPEQESRINEPAISQPCSTAIQLALVDLLGELGILPCAVVGHSSGEIAAAYAANLMSFEDAVAASYFRGKSTDELIAGKLECPGAMLAVGMDPAAVSEHINKIGSASGKMVIACFNSPSGVTVSGDSTAIDELKAVLDADGIFNRKLKTNGAAYHSHQMKAIEEEYAAALAGSTQSHVPVRSSVRMFSSVLGKEIGETAIKGDYWVKNLLSPVLFSQAFRNMCEHKFQDQSLGMVIEIGAHSQLAGPVNQILKTMTGAPGQVTYTSALKRGKNAEVALLECLGFTQVKCASLHIHDVNRLNDDPSLSLVDLPPYSFDLERQFWHETRISREYRHRRNLPHELLGTLSPDVNRLEPRWRRFLSLKESPWLRSHRVQGQIVFPGTGFLTMAVQSVRQHMQMVKPVARVESIVFRNISFGKGLVLLEDGPDVEVVLSLRPEARTARESSSIWSEFRIFTVTSNDTWTEHCRGLVHAETERIELCDAVPNLEHLSRIDEQCTHEHNPRRFYGLGHGVGVDWQHPFDNISSFRTSSDAAIATTHVPAIDTAPGGMGDILHPAMLDSCLFHGLCANLLLEKGAKSTLVPTFIEQLRISNQAPAPGIELICTSTSCQDAFTYDVVVQAKSSPNRELVLAAQGVHVTRLPGGTTPNQATSHFCHSLDWVTYVEAWTPEHRDQTCKSVVPLASTVELNNVLEALTLHYVQSALKEVNPADIPDGHRRHFFDWMESYAARSSASSSTLPMDEASLRVWPECEAALRIGPRLPDILTDKVDPLVLLTPDELLSRIYKTERCDRCIRQIAEYCHELGKQTPGLKVLEVGAGTGSATLPILQALNGRGGQYVRRYDYTDISSGFFEAARDRLGDLADVVEFGILDIDRDSQEQGFEAASYDLIISSNVIHASQSIDAALSSIRPLLKPGGRLILVEITKNMPQYTMLFGVFSGWWAGFNEGRTMSPLISRAQWISRLESTGFSSPELCFEDYPETDGGSISVFVANAPWQSAEIELPPVHFVTAKISLSEATFTEGQMNMMKKGLPELEISPYHLSMPSPRGGIAIILPEIARLLCDNPDTDVWHSFKDWVVNAHTVVLVSCGQIGNLNDAVRGLWVGFARTLRREHASMRIITLDLEVENARVMGKLAEILPTILETVKLDLSGQGYQAENEFAERSGQLFVSRFMPHGEMSNHIQNSMQQVEPKMLEFLCGNRSLTAEVGTPGLLETLCWKDDPEPPVLGPDDVKLEMRAASVNFKDVLIAAGQLDGITEMRNDCSGVVIDVGANMRERFKPGDRVCALPLRSYANYPVVDGNRCQVVPDDMSFEEAASVPVVWATVYYSLVDMGRLAKGDKILIHSAAGAVGQAAIMLAQHIGADVFVTVGNSSKRQFLHERYNVPYEHMFSSRTPRFYTGIQRLTDGYGVDVVLNSLSGEMFRQSCNLVAPFGRFVEIGRKDIMDDALMPMAFLLRNVTFSYVDLKLIIDTKKQLIRRLLQDVASLLAAGSVRPVQLTVMPISEIETAFRLIQSGKHTGKIILRVEENQKVKALPPLPTRAQFKPNATYAVIGGFGGLGSAIIGWMAEHGAKYILSVSRSGASNASSKALIKEMSTKGVNVIAAKCDITSRDEVASIVRQAKRDGLPPICGIIQAAMVLDDSVFEAMTVNQWQGAIAPKVQGTMNLHDCFTNEVDFFILMSSVVAIHGHASQSNYAAGCSFQDELARCRTAAGMTAYSINIGAVLEVGFVSENPEVAARFSQLGIECISISHLLALLNYAVTHPVSNSSAESVCAIGMQTSNDVAKDRRFAHLIRHDAVVHKTKGSSLVDLLQALEGSNKLDDSVDIICRAILHQLGKLIMTPAETLNPAQSLDSYGVDSLVAVELRNWIGARLQVNLPLMVLRGTSSISELAGIVAKESPLVGI